MLTYTATLYTNETDKTRGTYVITWIITIIITAIIMWI